VYPKKSYEISFKINSEDLSRNSFDFSGFISFVLRKLGRKLSFLNPFKSLSMISATTESSFDFSNEVTDDLDSMSSLEPSSSEEQNSTSNESSVQVEDDKSTNEDISSNENINNEYINPTTEHDVITITRIIGYLPPLSTPSYLFEPPK